MRMGTARRARRRWRKLCGEKKSFPNTKGPPPHRESPFPNIRNAPAFLSVRARYNAPPSLRDFNHRRHFHLSLFFSCTDMTCILRHRLNLTAIHRIPERILIPCTGDKDPAELLLHFSVNRFRQRIHHVDPRLIRVHIFFRSIGHEPVPVR